MKYVITWESCCEGNIEEFSTLKEAELRAKNVLEEDFDVEYVIISKGVKKFTRKIMEEKFDD